MRVPATGASVQVRPSPSRPNRRKQRHVWMIHPTRHAYALAETIDEIALCKVQVLDHQRDAVAFRNDRETAQKQHQLLRGLGGGKAQRHVPRTGRAENDPLRTHHCRTIQRRIRVGQNAVRIHLRARR